MFFKNYNFKGFTSEDYSFLSLKDNEFEIPLTNSNHPGSFLFKRKNHIHEGIDLYVKEDTEVLAIENGKIIDIGIFTGEEVNSPWWNTTQYISILVNDKYVYLYGELEVYTNLKINDIIQKSTPLGKIKPVLKEFKNNRPINMLHFEVYDYNKYKGPGEYINQNEFGLLDPLTIINLGELK